MLYSTPLGEQITIHLFFPLECLTLLLQTVLLSIPLFMSTDKNSYTRNSCSHPVSPGACLQTQSTSYLTLWDDVTLFPEMESPLHTPASSELVKSTTRSLTFHQSSGCEMGLSELSIWNFLLYLLATCCSSLKCLTSSFANFSIRESFVYL